MTNSNADVPSEYLLRVEAVNLGEFIGDSEDLSTIRGAGLLLLALHDILRHPSKRAVDSAPEPGAEPTATQSGKDLEPLMVIADGNTYELDCLSIGASIATYRFTATAADAAKVNNQISCWLRENPDLKHATFCVNHTKLVSQAVDASGCDQSFVLANERLIQATRRQQLRLPSVSIGQIERDLSTHNRFCDIDGRRAACVSLSEGEGLSIDNAHPASAADKNAASHSTAARRIVGRSLKMQLYNSLQQAAYAQWRASDIADKPIAKVIPSWDFEDIATRADKRITESEKSSGDDCFPLLRNKMAVIYIDGNKFASQIRARAINASEYKQVDEEIRQLRRGLIEKLAMRVHDHKLPYWRVKIPKDREKHYQQFKTESGLPDLARVETLLWGGDELIWVVPAWCALETLQLFFHATKDWSLTGDKKRLTHAVGMVLCSYKTPIRSVVQLARNLADHAKQVITPPKQAPSAEPSTQQSEDCYQRPESNVWSYQVLESFDHLGEDFAEQRRLQRFPLMTDSLQVLTAAQLNELIDRLNVLKHDVQLPQTRLNAIAKVLNQSSMPAAVGSGDDCYTDTKNRFAKLAERIAQTSQSGRTTEQIRSTLMAEFNSTTRRSFDHDAPSSTTNWPVAQGVARWFDTIELWNYLGSMDRSVVDLFTTLVQESNAR